MFLFILYIILYYFIKLSNLFRVTKHFLIHGITIHEHIKCTILIGENTTNNSRFIDINNKNK